MTQTQHFVGQILNPKIMIETLDFGTYYAALPDLLKGGKFSLGTKMANAYKYLKDNCKDNFFTKTDELKLMRTTLAKEILKDNLALNRKINPIIFSALNLPNSDEKNLLLWALWDLTQFKTAYASS